jgi:hypothetical protein
MTQQEFTQRTKVEVDSFEFNAVHVVYMSSDLDKDEFCKMWCKMNKSRVQEAKASRIQNQREAEYKKALFDWYTRWSNNPEYRDNWNTLMANTKISVYEIQAMSFAGILLGGATLHETHYEVGKYLGLIGA